MKKAVVIGGGIAGLATAALLAKGEYSVTLLEKNATVGGRAMSFDAKGFHFDMGPSWYQVPDAFDHFFQLFHKKTSDYYDLVKLDPQYRIFFENEARVDITPRLSESLDTFEAMEKGSKNAIQKYLKIAQRQYDISMKRIIYKNISLFDYINPLTVPDFVQLRIWQNLESFVKHYVKDHRLQKILLYTSLFVGSDPRRLPAVFSLMSYIDLVKGTYYPMGGMSVVIDAFASLCKEMGVMVRTNEEVRKIDVVNGRATNVVTDNQEYPVDVVVSNADYPFTETQLLDKQWQSYPLSYWNKQHIAPSCYTVYLGLNKKLKHLTHHNLWLANNWQTHFDDLYKDKQWSSSPSFYVSCPSKTDQSVAPKGQENVFIAVQIPSSVADTPAKRAEYFERIISLVEHFADEQIKKHIIFKKILATNDYVNIYNGFQGTAIGLATTFKQSMFRPSNKSKKVSNLYYAGQYTAPGIGLPMCVISAELAYKRIKTDINS